MADKVKLTEMQRRKKAYDDGFLCGLAYAAAWLSRDRGEDSEAQLRTQTLKATRCCSMNAA